jgi:4'-phosphopantetheinyl transferase
VTNSKLRLALQNVTALLHANRAVVLLAKASAVLETLPADRLALPSEEVERIGRYRNEADRRARFAAHGLLRHCLGQLLACPPETIQLVRDENGRPFLQKDQKVDFNISHSGNWIAVGICSAGRIGVDVQEYVEPFDWRETGKSFLRPAEMNTIASLPLPEQSRLALRFWCLKEALLKATGEGLVVEPNQLILKCDEDGWRLTRQGFDLRADSFFLADGSCVAWASNVGSPVMLEL